MYIGSLKLGFFGGIIAVCFSVMGIIESFHHKYIICEIFSLGETFLASCTLLFSYLAANKKSKKAKRTLFLHSVSCGFVTGSMICFLILADHFLELRVVLVNASEPLFQILTFSKIYYIGITIQLSINMMYGFLAGIFCLFIRKIQIILLTGLSAVIFAGVLQDMIRSLLYAWNFNFSSYLCDYLYPSINGLSISGAIYIFITTCVFSATHRYWAYKTGRSIQNRLPISNKTRSKIQYFFFMTVLITLPLLINSYICEVLTVIGIYILLGLGLNIVVGFAGLLDLGYVAFFAIGAYTIAILTSNELGIFNFNFWEALPFAVLLGVVAGILLGIPVLKMRGDYLAIVTLGFGEILRILVRADALKPMLNGSHGIGDIPSASLGSWVIDTPSDNYYLILGCCALAIMITNRLNHSRISRAWKAIREDEDVAQAMGINIVKAKLQAFAIGAGFSALSGAVFANKIGSVFPVSFNLIVSIIIMCIIIVGGLGSVKGVVTGSIIMIGLPELLREFSEFRYFFYGIALVSIMILKPEGLCKGKND